MEPEIGQFDTLQGGWVGGWLDQPDNIANSHLSSKIKLEFELGLSLAKSVKNII